MRGLDIWSLFSSALSAFDGPPTNDLTVFTFMMKNNNLIGSRKHLTVRVDGARSRESMKDMILSPRTPVVLPAVTLRSDFSTSRASKDSQLGPTRGPQHRSLQNVHRSSSKVTKRIRMAKEGGPHRSNSADNLRLTRSQDPSQNIERHREGGETII
eukprot:8747975-Pyramimonas_sp.AAC.1